LKGEARFDWETPGETLLSEGKGRDSLEVERGSVPVGGRKVAMGFGGTALLLNTQPRRTSGGMETGLG